MPGSEAKNNILFGKIAKSQITAILTKNRAAKTKKMNPMIKFKTIIRIV